MPTYDKTGIKIAACVVGALSLLLLCPPTLALDPSLHVSQYAHRAWRVREGFTQGYIRSVAQTPDGYIWLGTGFGLFRFDGVRAELWKPPLNGEQLPSDFVVSLHVTRDGTLWIGTLEGLVSLRDGRLTLYPDLVGSAIASILEDRNGTVWAGTFSLGPLTKLCAIVGTIVHCDELAAIRRGANALYEDSHDALWVVGNEGIWQWRPGPPKFYHVPFGTFSVQDLGEDANGALLIPLPGRLARFEAGKLETQSPYPAPAGKVEGVRLLRDRDGGVWIGTAGAGLVHVHNGHADVFSQADGLSGNFITSLFEDREGDVWVSTIGGLDRFRKSAIATYAEHEGIGTVPGWGSVVAAQDGSIWIGTQDGLRVWNHGEVTIYGSAGTYKSQSRTVWLPVRYVSDPELGDHVFVSVFGDRAGRILVSTPSAFGYMENGRFVSLRGVPGGLVYSVDQDRQGNLWIANRDKGLLRLSNDGDVQRISWASMGHTDGAQSLAADRSSGGLWLGFNEGGVADFSDGHIKRSYTRMEGLGNGRVSALYIDTDNTVWAGTDGGLSRIKNGGVLTLTSKNGLPCDGIHWITQDENHSFWLYMTCGLVRIERSELDAWVTDSRRKMKLTVFDSSEGVSNTPITFHVGSLVTRSLDGKIWFDGFLGGASVIDPQHLPSDKLPPPVSIERITADGKTYNASNGLRLPPRIRDLTIDYTALSFVAPEKVRFRFRLEGQDRDWREVVNDREVQYSNLPPRDYVFRVSAANNSGVWNEVGDTLHFSIEPAYYQTIWFRALCATGFLALLWALYQYRLRQVRRQFAVGVEVRVQERTRIARELHDTLLQSLHGLLFRFQAARNLFPRRPEEAMESLDQAIIRTEQAIAESQDAITDLRPMPSASDLGGILMATGKELETIGNSNGTATTFALTVEGERRTLSPNLQDEVYRIALELLRNAFRHACARRVETEVRYDDEQLRVRIRDDGKGMDPEVLTKGRRPGHWGLLGAKERAVRIGAHLDIWSEAGAGTEVQLRIPATVAYKNSHVGPRLRFFRK